MAPEKKTKIFCTMGPACWDVETLTTLIDAGMNTARFNFSHGDHKAHGACLDRVREAAALRPDSNLGILLDTKGPEIRTGFFQEKCNGKIHLKAGVSAWGPRTEFPLVDQAASAMYRFALRLAQPDRSLHSHADRPRWN